MHPEGTPGMREQPTTSGVPSGRNPVPPTFPGLKSRALFQRAFSTARRKIHRAKIPRIRPLDFPCHGRWSGAKDAEYEAAKVPHPAAVANPMKTFALLTMLLSLSMHAQARTWTSSDGRTIEAEFVRGDDKAVTIRQGAREFTLALEKISQADRDYVAGKVSERKNLDVSELGDYAKYATGQWVKGEEKGLPFQIHAPATYARDQKIPLVIFLHGIGERGADNEKQLNALPKTFASAENQAKRPCIVIAPQCPAEKFWPDMAAEIIAMTKSIAKNMPVDSGRIYLSGFSMGGYGVWALLAADPKLFAAAVPIAGGGNPQDARKLKDIPIWNFHGDADTAVNVSQSRTMVDALKKAKANITYTEMPKEGHGIAGKVLKDEKLQEWLFNQKQ